MIHAPPKPRGLQLEHQNHCGSQIQREPTCLTHLRNKSFASYFVKVSEIRPRFVVRNMLRHDPHSPHAKTTPIGASKPLRLRHDPLSSQVKTTPIGASKQLRFANTTRTDVFDSFAQQVFCLVSEIRPIFVIRNMLRHDPRSSHAKTTPIGASKPLRILRSDRDLSSGICQEIHAPPIP
ncbi:uncharacterized protein G2W53_041731 [Senna tora]|uniref:Uncharacterized protein n=1 Tax=Senna tora TaxID=362788 RepID=A0A834SHH8_9FABA|nr:uncharacterized protein G2W53_041731 [Senna tora]